MEVEDLNFITDLNGGNNMDTFFYLFIMPTFVLIFVGLVITFAYDLKQGKWSKKKPLPPYTPTIIENIVNEETLNNLPEALEAPQSVVYGPESNATTVPLVGWDAIDLLRSKRIKARVKKVAKKSVSKKTTKKKKVSTKKRK